MILDRVLQEKHYFEMNTGKKPEILEIGERLFFELETESKDSFVLKKNPTTTAKDVFVYGLKVVLTNTNTIKVK